VEIGKAEGESSVLTANSTGGEKASLRGKETNGTSVRREIQKLLKRAIGGSSRRERKKNISSWATGGRVKSIMK